MRNRYPGIYYFTEKEKDIFFGRDTDIENILTIIKVEKQLLLYAKSGVGKTSILQAGVVPRLPENFKPVFIRFQDAVGSEFSPVQRMIDVISTQFKDFIKPDPLIDYLIEKNPHYKLWYLLKKIELNLPDRTNTAFVLIFDQFEELFTYKDDEIEHFKDVIFSLKDNALPPGTISIIQKLRKEKSQFFSTETFKSLKPGPQIKPVFVIRSDKLNLLNRLADKIIDIQKIYYELKPLTEQQARQAIEKPAQVQGDFISPTFKYSPQAVDKIITFLSKNHTTDIEATQLQIICRRIEENIINQATTNTQIEVKPEDIPNFKNIFYDFYNDAIEKIPEQYRENARRLIEDKFIIDGRRVSVDQSLCEKDLPLEYLNILAQTHLIRAVPNSIGGFNYELAHDTLIEPIDEAAKERHKQEELRRLQEQAERERLEREKERRRQRQILLIVSIAAIISLCFAIFAPYQMRVAKQNLEKAIWYQVKGKQRDAISFKEQEVYRAAIEKYNELLQLYRQYPQYHFDSNAVYKDIAECKRLDSLTKIFKQKMKEADSLLKTNELENIKKAYELYSQAKDMDFETPSKKQTIEKFKLEFRIIAQNLINQANASYNAGGIGVKFAREITDFLIKIYSENPKIIKLYKPQIIELYKKLHK